MLFDAVSEAVAPVVPIEALRWITFGHVEADECGSMNQFLAAAPRAEAAHGALGCMASLDDLADLDPDTRAVMHGSSVTGHCSGALRGLADDDERRLLDSTAA